MGCFGRPPCAAGLFFWPGSWHRHGGGARPAFFFALAGAGAGRERVGSGSICACALHIGPDAAHDARRRAPSAAAIKVARLPTPLRCVPRGDSCPRRAKGLPRGRRTPPGTARLACRGSGRRCIIRAGQRAEFTRRANFEDHHGAGAVKRLSCFGDPLGVRGRLISGGVCAYLAHHPPEDDVAVARRAAADGEHLRRVGSPGPSSRA